MRIFYNSALVLSSASLTYYGLNHFFNKEILSPISKSYAETADKIKHIQDLLANFEYIPKMENQIQKSLKELQTAFANYQSIYDRVNYKYYHQAAVLFAATFATVAAYGLIRWCVLSVKNAKANKPLVIHTIEVQPQTIKIQPQRGAYRAYHR